MAEIDEKTLRETRGELVAGVTDLQRRGGRLPDVRQAEELVDPILAKVVVDRDREEGPPHIRTAENREAGEGEWYGEPGHSPRPGVAGQSRIAPARPGDKLSVTASYLGEYRVEGDHIVPVGNAPAGPPPMPMRERVLRELVRELWDLPDWRERLQKVTMSNLTGDAREKAFRKILEDAVRLFGPPIPIAAKRERDKKLIIS